ncbi:MAG: PspA/IM30 family protein, partial [Methanosarcinales archaeon]|nr:PspA/IM30 family protein [Methanosarcinales archaeon]
MGLFTRMELMVKSKANKLLDRHEDPREILDYSYQKQLELLQQVKRSVAMVVTAKKRLELQKAKLEQNTQKLDRQA